MHPRHYRIRLALDVVRLLVLPLLVLRVAIKLTDINLGYWMLLLYPFVVIACAVVRGWAASMLQAREARRLNAQSIPCVKGKWPGNADVFFRMMKAFRTSYILDVYLELFREYQCTTLNLRIFWKDMIITMDHEHLKFMTSTGFNHFHRGVAQKERLETFLGEGIFNRDDEMWKMHRTTARPFFARERISDFEIFERNSTKTISLMSSQFAYGKAVDVQDLFARFTLDAASEFLFGRNLDTLNMTLPSPGGTLGPRGYVAEDSWGSFTKAFEMAQQVVMERGRIGYLWPLFEMFSGGDRNREHVEVIHRWLDPVVEQALRDREVTRAIGAKEELKDKTFLQHLVESTNDPILVRDELLSMLLASRDTTACLLTFVVYFMALHPHVAHRLRQEVLETCGVNGSPTYESIRKLKYMRAVIQETLRLFPPVPLNVRESRSSSVTLPRSDSTFTTLDDRPYHMPANTVFMIFPLLMQRNPALWGPDADVFDPERWMDKDKLGRFLSNPTIFTPFSAGPRICIGQNYALNEASYFLVRLLLNFDTFTLASDLQPPESLPPHEWRQPGRSGRQVIEGVWPAAALTLFVKGGLWVRVGKTEELT